MKHGTWNNLSYILVKDNHENEKWYLKELKGYSLNGRHNIHILNNGNQLIANSENRNVLINKNTVLKLPIE